MGRYIRWAAINGFFAAMLYLGIHEGIEGAQNLVYAIIIFTGLMSTALLTDNVILAYAKLKTPKWFKAADVTFDLAVLGYLVWNSWFWCGGVYFFHLFMCSALRVRAEELRERLDLESAK